VEPVRVHHAPRSPVERVWMAVDVTVTNTLCLAAAYAVITGKANEAAATMLAAAFGGMHALRRRWRR
jgi:hypothetical protein